MLGQYCTPDGPESQDPNEPPVVDGVNLWSLQDLAAKTHRSGKRAQVVGAFLAILFRQFPMIALMYDEGELEAALVALCYAIYVMGRTDGW